jgi:hypothetical protein
MEPNRTLLLNHLAAKHNLKRYLEIGVQNPIQNFDKIICDYKVSIDPDPEAQATFCMTSDEFFKDALDLEHNGMPPFYDLIFIDGLHTAEQVKKDFENAMHTLSPDGFIMIHDCNPLKEEHTIVPRPTKTGHWNGDVYKFAVCFEESPHVFTVDVDNGCMVIQKKDGLRWSKVDFILWDFFDEYRKRLLNLISWDEFIALNSDV